MTLELLWQIAALFTVLFVAGTVSCLPLYGWNIHRFFHSKLWLKIYWWLPLFAGFVFVLFGRLWVTAPLTALLSAQAIREYLQQKAWHSRWANAYLCLFLAAFLHLFLITGHLSSSRSTQTLVSVGFASVLSDVFAFFVGSYAGRHALPAWISPRKSWEGVSAQIGGAIIGLSLVACLPAIHFSWLLALGVGFASTAGDLANSVVKRQLDIKDWSKVIPGHGGVLDRFSSLALALAAGYWLVR